jgi:succinate-semialdehyde dehydrogenase/glutarate-semialdehyde dehydrogenase
MSLESINPVNGEVLERFDETAPAEVARIVEAAHAAFHEWRARPFAARAERMREAARILRARRADHARAMALEMGKPLAQGEAEIEKCATACDYYAEHAAHLLADEPRATEATVATSASSRSGSCSR